MTKKAKVCLMTPNLMGMKGGVNRIQASLGIGYLASVLRKAEHEVYIRDTALEGYNNEKPLDGRMIMIGETNEEISSYISSVNPDIVGISVLFSNLMEHAHTLAKIVKQVNSSIKIVLGGNHISNTVKDYLFAIKHPEAGLENELVIIKDKNIDYFMKGEVEEQFLELVNKLINKEDPIDVEGLVYIKDGQLKINNSPASGDIRKLPFPARDLMNMEGYFKVGLFHSGKSRSKRVLNVMASRGCPEKCSFCTTPQMWGPVVRWRDPQNIYEEIKHGIDKYNIGEVQFEDDTLTLNRKKLLELCDLIKPLGIHWCTPNGTKVNYHKSGNKQYELYKRMADSGCYQITLACESGVQRVLDDIIHKNLKIEEIQPSIENAKKAGLMVHTFWIAGYPGETREEMEKTIEFAAQVGADSYSVAILSPLPGTPIYHQVMRQNLWWDSERKGKDLLYRNSLVRVDGFDSAEEFESWVEEKTMYLNKLLEKRDNDRFMRHYKEKGSRFLLKQT